MTESTVASPLTPVAEEVATARYYQRNIDGSTKEDWEGLAHRVVDHVCRDEDQIYKEEIFDLILHTKFLPNSPCLVNSGTKVGGLLACFVTKSPEDSWVGMMENLGNFGHIARRGGGCGVDFSNIRPEGDPVFGSTHAKACGPIQHMRVVSEAMSSITQAGFRGMANMGVLRCDHPDIMKFIVCKQRDFALKTLLKEDIFQHYDQLKDNLEDQTKILLDKFISNFNISVLTTNAFLKEVEEDQDFNLVFEGKVYKTVKAREVFDMIVKNAWSNGDPGMLFYEAMNSGPYKYSNQELTATNPCGEQMLPQYGSCNLGSIDVSKFYDKSRRAVDWDGLRSAIQLAFRFLDNVISINLFPTEDFARWAEENRPVGLGIMGWADLLLKLRISYGSSTSLALAEKISKFFQDTAHETSVQLGKEKGSSKCCQYKELKYRRNVTTISIAPTGTISLLAGCSSSVEPIFAPVIYRYDNTGQYELPHPDSDKQYFRCALDKGRNGEREVTWQQHVDMQAAFQKYCDSGISKTINMPNNATPDDIRKAYLRAWKSGCKGITIYRDGCKTAQVLNTEKKIVLESSQSKKRPKTVDADIHKTKADGREWHIIVGKVDDSPYEIFAVNGKINLPGAGKVIKRRKMHYALVAQDSEDVIIDNLNSEECDIDPRLGGETRRFSLELRHGIPLSEIVSQIDKSTEKLTSFSKAVGRVLKKNYINGPYVAEEIACPFCAKDNEVVEMVSEAGCWRCPRCSYSKCG